MERRSAHAKSNPAHRRACPPHGRRRARRRVAAARAATDGRAPGRPAQSPGAVAVRGDRPMSPPSRRRRAGARRSTSAPCSRARYLWIDMQRPGQAEIEWLKPTTPASTRCTSTTSSAASSAPSWTSASDYLFLVLHFPVYNKITRLTTASEVDIFAGPGYLITVHSGHLRPLLRLFDQARDDADVRGAGAGARLGLPALYHHRQAGGLLLPHPEQDRPEHRAAWRT